MLCKKCGANIEETSKFCGYCGNPVENSLESQSTVFNNETFEDNNVDLGQTIQIEPIQEGAEISSFNQINHNQNLNDTTSESQQIENQIPNNMNGMVEPKNKKKNNWIFIISGILLASVAIIVLVFSLMKSSNNNILVLEQAIDNLSKQGENSATVDANLSLATSNGDAIEFSLTVKTEKKNNDKIDMLMTLNKSLLFDEMNVYASMDQKEINMYMESSLIDMFGMTSSLEPTWIYYTMSLDEMMETNNVNETELSIDLHDLLTKEHFVYIDKVGELKHYVLTIDQGIIDNITSKLPSVDEEAMNGILSSMVTLEKPIKIDFYITKNNELSKIELNMSEHLEEVEDISKLVFSISFSDLNSTKVEIPDAAKNSTVDLETYMMTDSYENDYQNDYEYDYENDYNWDENYYYDSSIDSQL